MQKTKGFTLLELVLVSVIIGVLASIGSVYYFKAVERGRAAEAYATLSMIVEGESVYRAAHGSYTLNFGDLETMYSAPKSDNFVFSIPTTSYATASRTKAKNSYFMCLANGKRGACLDVDACPAPNCNAGVYPLY